MDALPHTDPAEIKKNLVAQLTASVRWTQSVKNMVADGATDFTECGPGAVLQGLIKKIDGTVTVSYTHLNKINSPPKFSAPFLRRSSIKKSPLFKFL